MIHTASCQMLNIAKILWLFGQIYCGFLWAHDNPARAYYCQELYEHFGRSSPPPCTNIGPRFWWRLLRRRNYCSHSWNSFWTSFMSTKMICHTSSGKPQSSDLNIVERFRSALEKKLHSLPIMQTANILTTLLQSSLFELQQFYTENCATFP